MFLVLELFLLIVGVALLVISLFMYIKRTGDKSFITKFWASKKDLSKSELIINRLGIALVTIGLVLGYVIK